MVQPSRRPVGPTVAPTIGRAFTRHDRCPDRWTDRSGEAFTRHDDRSNYRSDDRVIVFTF